MVVVIMGVSGSGKTTVGAALAGVLGAPFLDADDMHSIEHVEKMRSGEPLTESDREPWLLELRARIDAWLGSGTTAVLACSALTRRSRELLGTDRDGVELVFLNGGKELIEKRMRAREHFMPESLLESQLATLEPPDEALEIDAGLPCGAVVAIVENQLSS